MISVKQSTVLGTTQNHSAALQITVPAILASLPLIYLVQNGVAYMNHKAENEEYSAVRLVKNKLQETVDEIVNEISERTHAVKSSLDQINSATFQKLSSDRKIQLTVLGEKYELRLSWVLSKPRSRTSDT